MSKLFPKTLVLSRSVPPSPAGTATIIGNLVKQFKRQEMLVLGAKGLNSPSISWSERWPTIRHVTFMPPSSWRGARYIRWLQWPWLFLFTLLQVLLGAYDVLLTVFSDDIYLLTGYLVSRLTKKPLYAYFHDVYLDSDSESRLAHWLEPRVFAHAKHVFVMSEALRAYYQPTYLGQTITPLVHTFNEPIPFDVSVPDVHLPLRLALLGNINVSNKDAVSRFAQLVSQRPDTYLTIYSGSRHSVLDSVGLCGERVNKTLVSRDVLLDELVKADVLLLPHGFRGNISDDDIQTIFPTRTIEYLISGRPILAHAPAGCFLTRFLQAHGCALVVTEPSVAALAEALARLQEDGALRQRLVDRALQTAEQFQAHKVAGHMREVMAWQ